jgi:hypothetical protein
MPGQPGDRASGGLPLMVLLCLAGPERVVDQHREGCADVQGRNLR